MPIPWKVMGGIIAMSGICTDVWFLSLTNDIQSVPLPATDPILQSSHHKTFNPNNNPTIHDMHIKKVPLSQINPSLAQDRQKLLERYCGGIWAGHSFAPQRILQTLFDRKLSISHLWSPSDLLLSNYKIGTEIAGNFEAIDRSPESVLIRGGDKTSNKGLRPLDGLIEITVHIDREQAVAEFGFKSLFFQGIGTTNSHPMPAPMVWLHEQYAKALWCAPCS